ncbi:hypothetical protein NM688_g7407 [Phlebia brevispora]|uniref:Uncharacterized protein n=1 Tax=Phlebia brevispora TaxID=194682 RepID=A0ACC1S5F3_9APHY|nr:hypothetical protein NM688_g7407 [Phlebia brevispora]
MPRRPRPASRRPPPGSLKRNYADRPKPSLSARPTGADKSKLKLRKPVVLESEDQDSEHSASEVTDLEGSENDSEDGLIDEDSEADVDIDAPRVAQWVDEEELKEDQEESDDGDEGDNAIAGPSNLKVLQDGLSALPLGTLRKAQRALANAKVDSDSDDGSDEDSLSAAQDSDREQEQPHENKEKTKEKVKPQIEKRKNKHAPIEMSSRRRERRKIIVEDKKPAPRDPRFLSVTGEFSAERFRAQYGFLSGLHKDELTTLKDNLKRARRMLASSPRDQREAREAEVQRLERTVKRAESTVNKDKRDQIEQSAMQKAHQEEREKRKQGKGAWYMKKTDEKNLLTRARYDALAESGGKRAVKKAIEKKQKKVSQKEKKRRPFAPDGAGKRQPTGQGDNSRPTKRQRFG